MDSILDEVNNLKFDLNLKTFRCKVISSLIPRTIVLRLKGTATV